MRAGQSAPVSRGRIRGDILIPAPATLTPFVLAGGPFRDFSRPLKANEQILHRIVLYGWNMGGSEHDYTVR